jgi:predicted kinase
MPKLIVLRGLPGAGKSVYAAQLVMKGFKRVSVNELSTMMSNTCNILADDPIAIDAMQAIVLNSLQYGYDTVIDSTNFERYTAKFAAAVARETKSTLEFIDIDTPLDVCISRDLARDSGRVGKDVIMYMYEEFFTNGKFPEVP